MQIILGTGVVNKVYDEFIRIAGVSESSKEELKKVEMCIRDSLSSAGRASALQAEGHRFEPYRFHTWMDSRVAKGGRL